MVTKQEFILQHLSFPGGSVHDILNGSDESLPGGVPHHNYKELQQLSVLQVDGDHVSRLRFI